MTTPLPIGGASEPGRASPCHRALIVAHGQPSDPCPAEAALSRFAERVAAQLPAGWQVEAATLAAPGALEAALAGAGAGASPLLVYPMFIADGWFTQVNLPARLRAAGMGIVQTGSGTGSGERTAGDGTPERTRQPGEAPARGRFEAPPPLEGARDAGAEGCPVDEVRAAGRGARAEKADVPARLGQDDGGAARDAAPHASTDDGSDEITVANVPSNPSLPAAAAAAAAAVSPAAAVLPPNRGMRNAQILPPFGLDPGILPLALQVLAEALAKHGLRAVDTGLLVAAHGSFKSPAPAAVARRLARAIIAEFPFAQMRTAFIDQAPRIADFARGLPTPTLCLPLFAAAGGHVEEDLPAALAEAEVSGHILAPLGLAEGAPALVAAALLAASET